jgi:hypothetical protein
LSDSKHHPSRVKSKPGPLGQDSLLLAIEYHLVAVPGIDFFQQRLHKFRKWVDTVGFACDTLKAKRF